MPALGGGSVTGAAATEDAGEGPSPATAGVGLGALVGSLPLVVLYAFFVEHYVSAMTGAVKE